MAYSQLGVIEAADYNNFVSTLNSIWGTGSGSHGYGQASLLSTTVSSAEIVTATQWQNLIARAKTISQHQGLSISGLPTTVSAGDRIDFLSRLSTNMTSVDGARFNGSNGTTVTQSPVPSAISWNLLAPTTLQMVYTATWADADQVRYFFNAGGKLRLTLSATDNGPSSKGADWASLINTTLGGAYTISATESTYASFTGPGGSSSTGYWDLTTSDATLNTLTSTTTGYTNNSITVKARTNGTQGSNGDNGTIITITVDLSDDGLNPTDAWGDSLNISIANQLDLLPPENGYLTTAITNPTVARSSYVIDTSGTMPAGVSFDYYAAGTYSWTVPSGVTSIRAMVVGGGGGGGSSEQGDTSCSGDGGGGGGGGEFAAGEISVTPGDVLSLVVGSAGAGGATNSPGGTGGTSYIYNTSNVQYCISLDSGDFLSVPYNTATDIMSGDFTIECWVYPSGSSGVQTIAAQWGQAGIIYGAWILGLDYSTSDKVKFWWCPYGIDYVAPRLYSSFSFSRNRWQHIAVTRSGSSFYMFLDGKIAHYATGDTSTSGPISTPISFGNFYNSSGILGASGWTNFSGKIRSFRLVKGTASYTGSTTTYQLMFDPNIGSRSPTGAALLIGQTSSIIDESSNNFTITTYSTPTVVNESTILVASIGGGGGGAGGNGNDPSRGIGAKSGQGGAQNNQYWSGYKFSSTGGGSSNAQRCSGGCCAGYDGGDLGWSTGSIFTERPNGGYAALGAAGLAGGYSGGGGGGGASLGDGGRGGNGSGSSPDGRSAGMPGAYGGGGGGSCDEVIGGNARGAGGTGYIYVEYGGASPATTTAQLTLVGGGGGGGNGDNASGGGGGGGGAGVVAQSLTLAPGNYYAVVIGGGGAGGISNSLTFPANGSQSSFGSVAAYGGGGGGRSSYYSNCPTSSLIASTGGGFGRAISACLTSSGQGGTGGSGGGSTAGSTTDAGGGGGGGGSYYNGSSGTAASVNGGNGGDGGAGDNITAATTTMLFGSGSTAGYSAFFGGSAINDYIFINTTSVFDSGSSDFTIESWIYLMAMPTSDAWPTDYSSHMVIAKVGSPTSSNGFGFVVGQTKLIIHGTGDTQYASSAHGMSALTWYHVAAVRSGNNIYFYVNGVGKGSVAFSESPESVGYTYIGSETNQGAYFHGYMSNLRVVKGTAVYTADFTPSTAALTAISGTSLLVFQSASMVDNSTNNFTLTRPSWNGPTVETFHPANAGASETLMYGAGGGGGSQDGTAGFGGGTNYGYSVYLDGSGDYMSVPYDTATNIRSGDFTVECWFNTQISSGITVIAAQWQQTTNPSWAITLNHSSSGKVGFFWGLLSEASPMLVGNSYTVNKWHHVAIVRSGDTWHLFQDGIRVDTNYGNFSGSAINVNTTFGINYNSSGTLTGTGLTDYMGYISHFRLVKGTAVYTSNFNPSKNITYVSGTGLLMCKSSTIIETANGFTITTYGSPTVSSFIVGPAGNGGKRGYIGSPGLANSGSGAGGTGVGLSGITGAAGGSGIAIISYSGSSPKATGGTIVVSGGTVTHKFTSSGAFRMIPDPISANVVIVGGGGGGGIDFGGGGGAGGYLYQSATITGNVSYTIVIGAGGAGGGSTSSKGTTGSNTTAFSLTSYGGGGGGSSLSGTGASGASGGGGTGNGNPGADGGSALYGSQGNAGGHGGYSGGGGLGGGGGGGGAATAGGNSTSTTAGAGGAGVANPIVGSTSGQNVSGTYYLAGGGGGGGLLGYSFASAGGNGGGGAGSASTNTSGTAGTTNTGGGGGGGGGGGSGSTSSGGSGLVIVRYQSNIALATGGNITTYTTGSDVYQIHTFTSSGTFALI